jgi:hypothetical protein
MEDREMPFFEDESEWPDDVDCLFHLLQSVEPPAALIRRIIAQAQTPYGQSSIPASQRLQSQIAKNLLEHLVILPLDEPDARQLRRNLC